MDGFEKRRNDKKKAIMQAALELFDQYGFDKVTVTEIADKAHVSKVSIYNFFESKDNLRRIIIKDMLDESTEKIQALIEKDGNFIEKIEEYIQIRTWYFGKYSLRFFFEAVESDPELRQYLDDFNVSSKQLVMTFIEKGKRSGVFSPDASNTAIEIYINMIQTYLMHNKEIRDKIERNPELAREINMLFMDGLIRGTEFPRT
ncbi:TetR/AcrR family transcriptional regulator [Faecalicatena contorta]|uniref:DNA-binding transcriptional regulator, AcrR family n=1 Tax=Faecalicatena contorta TaxID=39482 RepID=A0A315ZRZ7_9FIRM|nr:TetR/AcrR family transcriptional regulator [Faecalicatena contorta]PWJ48069.1 TetR family transcriptional regulator [Faecalicatena contorta]SUQ15596.1 DNA-binding transcriptional regulator, AcrR family [Faecalicatena contorta]